MKVEIEVDDKVYALMERLASEVGVNLEEFWGTAVNQLAFSLGANLKVFRKAVEPDASDEDKSAFLDMMTEISERSRSKVLGQVYECGDCHEQFRIPPGEAFTAVECPQCHREYTREQLQDLLNPEIGKAEQ